MKHKNIFLIIILIILSILFFISTKNTQKKVITEQEEIEQLETEETENGQEEKIETILVKDGLWSNMLQPIDINNDDKDEVFNFLKTASWTNYFYILTPAEDGTFKLFCKNCSFEFNASQEIFDLIDLDDDEILEVYVYNLEDKTSRIYRFVNNDYKLVDDPILNAKMQELLTTPAN